MDIETHTKLLRLKGYLNELNHITYSYSQIGRNAPLHTLDNATAEKLISTYELLLDQAMEIAEKIRRDEL